MSAWTVVASQVFPRSTVDDLTFASAVAVGALAIAGLTVNELRAERALRSFEVHEGRRERDRRPIAA